MSWLSRFDEAILLPDGTELATLQDAIKYLAKTVSRNEWRHPAVATAATIITQAAEGRDFMMHAHIATMKAIFRNEPTRPFNPDRKDPHWGRRKLKRDQ